MAASDAIQPTCPPLAGPTSPQSAARKAVSPPIGSQRGPLSTSANFRWALAGNLTYAGCQWLMSVALARLGSVEALGQFFLGLAIAAPVMNLAMLQLRNVQVTDVHEEYAFADYFGTRIIWTIVGLLAIVVCAVVGRYDAITIWVVVLVGLMKAFDSLSDIIRGLFQHRERMDLSGLSLIVKGPPSLMVLAAVMALTRSVVIATAAMASVWALSFATYDLRRAARILIAANGDAAQRNPVRPRFDATTLWRLTWTAFPLGIVMAIISLQTNIPRYVLPSYGGNKALGYFGAIVAPMMAGMMVTTALGQSAAPKLARYFTEDLKAFVRLLAQLSALSAGLALVLIAGVYFFGDLVLTILYGGSYAAYHKEFVVVAIALGIQLVGSCWGYGLTAARYFRVQVALTSVSCVATLIASLLLVPKYGVMGASESVLVTCVAMAVGFGAMVVWAIRVKQRTIIEAGRV